MTTTIYRKFSAQCTNFEVTVSKVTLLAASLLAASIEKLTLLLRKNLIDSIRLSFTASA